MTDMHHIRPFVMVGAAHVGLAAYPGQEHEDIREAFYNGVAALLDAHSTVASALYTWPTLRVLLPTYLQHLEPTFTYAGDKVAVDKDKLTAVVVAAKLRGAV